MQRQAATLVPGARLGRYEVVSAIGSGGMGQVYRARDTALKRDVAVKILGALPDAADARKRFEREAQAAAALSHPGIVAVHDVGVDASEPYVVMELLEGETLRARLLRGPLPLPEAMRYAEALARAVAHAHEHGIVHRDLKPENVFLTHDGGLKVLDFGLARWDATGPASEDAETRSLLTSAGTTLGTVGYMAPEQVRGETAGSAADVFAYGAVLYEMLEGSRAFRGASTVDVLHAILHDDPPPLAPSKAPPAVARLVARCLEKDVARRFASGGEALAALEAAVSAPEPRRTRRAPRAALAAAVILAVVGLGVWLAARRAPSARIGSIAVLPLDNFSKDPSQEYFSDGMTEALIADLAQIGSLRVISRTSVMPYKRSGKTLGKIARELNVDALIEGSVLLAGGRARITAQLVDARSDRHLWAKSYERDLKDVLSIQSEVALAVAREIAAKLTPEEAARLGPKPVDPEAQELYLKGRYRLAKLEENDIRAAIALFDQAIGHDPRFARAYAGLADAFSALRSVYAPPRAVMPQAKAAALKALELDDALPEAHTSVGDVRFFYEFDWSGAEREYKTALRLNPSFAPAHDSYATLLAALGRGKEAEAEIARAVDLDPLSGWIRGDVAWIRYLGRDYPGAVQAGLEAVAVAPEASYAHAVLGLAYERVGRYEDAVKELAAARRIDDNTMILETLAGTYAAWGKGDEARRVLAELEERRKRSYVCPYEIATVYAMLGDKERAIDYSERAKEERADCFPWIKADPKLDALRNDPRFGSLLASVGLPVR